MIKIWDVTIPSLTGDKPRRAYVYLPTDYGTGKHYPVLYMFDGHNLFDDNEATFGKSWGLSDYLDRTKTPLIVAAVECNHEGNSRLSEYSPVDFTFHSHEKIKGRGKKYMDWLVTDFKSYIDAHFDTLPDRANTAIAGSSMGGLMTLFALAKYNRYFSKGAALSPSLWAYNTSLSDFIQKAHFFKNTVLYMDNGSKEFDNRYITVQNFAQAAADLSAKNVMVTSRIVPGGTHCEASWERQIPIFMRVLGFYPDKEQL